MRPETELASFLRELERKGTFVSPESTDLLRGAVQNSDAGSSSDASDHEAGRDVGSASAGASAACCERRSPCRIGVVVGDGGFSGGVFAASGVGDALVKSCARLGSLERLSIVGSISMPMPMPMPSPSLSFRSSSSFSRDSARFSMAVRRDVSALCSSGGALLLLLPPRETRGGGLLATAEAASLVGVDGSELLAPSEAESSTPPKDNELSTPRLSSGAPMTPLLCATWMV